MRPRIATLVVAVLLLAGCATSGSEDDSDQPGGVSDGVNDPVGLVNLWRVTGAEGEDADTWWRADADGYDLIRPCGVLSGGWRATADQFLAGDPYSWHEACGETSSRPSVPWLVEAVAYQPDGDGWRLLAADGSVLATLRVDGTPGPIPSAGDSYREPPEVSDEVRAALAPPAPLPAGLDPVTSDTLVGRWDARAEDLTSINAGGTPSPNPYPYVEVLDDRTWTGTDGCNGSGGAWAVGDDGWLLITGGASTLMACDGAPVPAWFSSAARAGLDGDELVLTDHDGATIATLVRG